MCNYIILFLLSLIAQPLIAQKSHTLSIKTSIATSLPVMGVAGPVAGVLQNHLIVAGGANFPHGMPWKGGSKTYHDEIFIYHRTEKKEHQQHKSSTANARNSKIPLALELVAQDQQLPEPIAYAALCNIEDGLIVIGGENTSGISNKVWLLQWQPFNKKIEFKSYPALPIPITNASAICINSRIYLLGGETATTTSDMMYLLDKTQLNKGWQVLGKIPKPLSHMVLTAIENEQGTSLYVMGGRQKSPSGVSSFSNQTFRYQIQTNAWETLADMPYPMSAGTGVWLNADQILLFGGDKGIVFNQVEKLLVAIAKESDPEKKQALINQKNKLQESHPGFSKEILGYAAKTNRWQVVGHLSEETPVTTQAFIWNDAVYIPSGETKAGVRSPHILKINIQPPNRE